MERGAVRITEPVTAVAGELPGWARLVRAPNPGPMTLDGTNTWVLRAPGAAASVVADPGPDLPDHLAAVAGHGPVAGILITHSHPDHVEGLARFQELTGAPVLDLDPDGDELVGLAITRLATPGHTADSVSFLVAAAGQQVVLTGDTILGRGTTVVAWPDGDLGDYLASLRRLSAVTGVPVLPGHGPALADCADAAAHYLHHRQARLDQVRQAMAAGATTPAAVVDAVYPEVDESLRPAAEWSAAAQLAYLRESPTGSAPLDVP